MATSIADLPKTAGRHAPAQARPSTRSTLLFWLVGFIIWTALALLSTLDTLIFLWSTQRPVQWSVLLPTRLVDWYSCAVFTPAYFWMVRRWPLARRGASRTISIYLGITIAIVILRFALQVSLLNALRDDSMNVLTLRQALTGSFLRENIAFWCLLAVVLSIEYYRGLRERETQAARLETRLAEARLDALAAQLHPHFLFNTIQGISTLIHRDPNAADEMLARLSTLLRHTLQRADGHEIPLAEELELLDLYVGIVRARFGDRLDVRIDVAADVTDALVPRFVFQPLVENALHHGVARRAGAGRIEITAGRHADTLVLSVTDDGPGLEPGAKPFPADGIGLANTRERLEQLYGAGQRLDVGAGAEGGFAVTLHVPWHTMPEDGR